MSALIPFALFAVLIVTVIAYQVKQRRTFVSSARAFGGAETVSVLSEGSWASMPTLDIQSQGLSVTLRAAGGGKNNPARWDLQVHGLKLGERTTLTVGKEGVFSALGKMLNIQDVQVGQPNIDDKYLIKGSDPDVIRGVFAHRPLIDALHRVFDNRRVFGLALQQEGRLDVSLARSRFSFEEGLGAAQTILQLAAALSGAADAEAVPEPAPERVPQNLSASGPASGTPVGIGFRE